MWQLSLTFQLKSVTSVQGIILKTIFSFYLYNNNNYNNDNSKSAIHHQQSCRKNTLWIRNGCDSFEQDEKKRRKEKKTDEKKS